MLLSIFVYGNEQCVDTCFPGTDDDKMVFLMGNPNHSRCDLHQDYITCGFDY